MLLFIGCFVLSIVGIYGFFTGSPNLITLGGCACLIQILIGWLTGLLKEYVITFITVALSYIVCLLTNYNPIHGICVGLCIETIILSVESMFLTIFSQKHLEKMAKEYIAEEVPNTENIL